MAKSKKNKDYFKKRGEEVKTEQKSSIDILKRMLNKRFDDKKAIKIRVVFSEKEKPICSKNANPCG